MAKHTLDNTSLGGNLIKPPTRVIFLTSGLE